MHRAIHFQLQYFAGIDDRGTRMIHQCKGLRTKNENEKIAGGEGKGSARILES
jgi:hypothetical protein